jgi:hypothetical protein
MLNKTLGVLLIIEAIIAIIFPDNYKGFLGWFARLSRIVIGIALILGG